MRRGRRRVYKRVNLFERMLDINEIFEKGLPFDGHYRLVELLSTAGGSADVWLAIDLNTIEESGQESNATKVVIKIYRPKNIIDIDGEYQFRKEFKKVFGCHHENIIQPTYFSIFEESPYLVLPYCPAGSSELLTGQLTAAEDIWKYIFEVSSGLAYLHEHSPQIIHQDIKPANVLIDDNGNYAITDFGISAEMGGADIESEDESGGTFAYMAPERFVEGTPPMPESDIWAFGATLYELITGDAPFGNEGGGSQKKEDQIPSIAQKIPDTIKKLIYSCLSYDIRERPTARQIVDTVLKKRYSRSRRVIALIISVVVVLATGISLYFVNKGSSNVEDHLESLCLSADSIVSAQVSDMESNGGIPSSGTVPELKKGVVLMNKVLKDAPDSYSKKSEVRAKLSVISGLIERIEEYDCTSDLVENARETEMEDSVIKYSLVLENQKININQLLQQLK